MAFWRFNGCMWDIHFQRHIHFIKNCVMIVWDLMSDCQIVKSETRKSCNMAFLTSSQSYVAVYIRLTLAGSVTYSIQYSSKSVVQWLVYFTSNYYGRAFSGSVNFRIILYDIFEWHVKWPAVSVDSPVYLVINLLPLVWWYGLPRAAVNWLFRWRHRV